jgi:hypothetical protein
LTSTVVCKIEELVWTRNTLNSLTAMGYVAEKSMIWRDGGRVRMMPSIVAANTRVHHHPAADPAQGTKRQVAPLTDKLLAEQLVRLVQN